MDEMLAGLDGCFAYLDDIIIATKTKDEQIRKIFLIFERLFKYGFRVQLDKCNFFSPEITFLGHVISKDGIRPNPSKVQAIDRMPSPTNISEVRAFLGALNFYGRYLKEMRDLRAPLDQLLRKDVPFIWSDECEAAVKNAKRLLLSDLILTHFDVKKSIIVAADASKNGVGASISHRMPDGSEKVIEFASSTLKPAEVNYSQIEKEGLALIFAVKKFHKYIYGRKFTLLTDHKPLLAIFGSKKGISAHATSRLQRWALILSAYDFDIKYIKTTEFGNVDVLSRLIGTYRKEDEDFVIAAVSETETEMEEHLISQLEVIPVLSDEVAQETATDKLLQDVVKCMNVGWPKKAPQGLLSSFYCKRNALSLVKGCLLLDGRVVIPEKLKSRILTALHLGHPGIVRMKALPRSYVYWPGIDSYIETKVKSCESCAGAAKQPIKADLKSWTPERQPWQRIHIDFAGPIKGRNFLLVIDAYSKWPEVYSLPKISSKNTISALNACFNRYGYPPVLVSDNGTQFTSAEFRQFCVSKGIRHVRSTPYHPQSNGQVERFVDSFKRSLQKNASQPDLEIAASEFLRVYRFTPTDVLKGKSPAELFLGRKIRTEISLIMPEKGKKLDDNGIVNAGYRRKMEKDFNKRHGVKFRDFNINDEIYYSTPAPNGHIQWKPAVVAAREGNVIYRVNDESGLEHRRHVNQMRGRISPAMSPVREQDPVADHVGPDQAPPVENGQIVDEVVPNMERAVAAEPIMPHDNPPRYPRRQPKPKQHFEMDPTKKKYEYN